MSSKSKAKGRMELVKNEGGASALSKMFKKREDINRKGFNVRSRPPTIKPTDFSPGMVLEGVLKSVERIEGTAHRKGESVKPWVKIHIVPEGEDIGVSMAAGAMIAQALDIEIGDDGAECPFIGHLITVELGDPIKLPSKKGNEAWNFVVAVSPDKV